MAMYNGVRAMLPKGSAYDAFKDEYILPNQMRIATHTLDTLEPLKARELIDQLMSANLPHQPLDLDYGVLAGVTIDSSTTVRVQSNTATYDHVIARARKEILKEITDKINTKYAGQKFIMVKPDDLVKFLIEDK